MMHTKFKYVMDAKQTFRNWMVLSFIYFVLILPGVMAQNEVLQFKVVAKHANGMSSQSNVVTINRPLSFYIPTAFSPDNDGLNDVFRPEGESVMEFRIEIYDRWGHVVYSSSEFNQGWNGTVYDEKAAEGVYAYQIYIAGFNNEIVSRAGHVTIVYP